MKRSPIRFNKIQDFIVFFKNLKSNPAGLVYLFMIFVVPFFLIAFQNCKATDLDTSLLGSDPEGTNYNLGHIIRIDPETDDFIEDVLLPIDTDIKMKFINAHEDADNYKWTINRGFDPIVTDASTSEEIYQTQFSQVGAYDVFANSYESETFLRSASKRFVAGESCSLTDVLEIELSSGSLQVGQSATFGLRHSDDFSSTRWKATLPSGGVIEQTAEENTDDEEEDNQEDPNTLEISFEDESEGDLVIEVSASHVDRNDCLTYRKQSLNLTSTLRPHFNPIVITDGSNEIAVMLENNDVYKYERPTNSGPYLQVEVLHADTCSYQVNEDDETSFTCDSGSIDISLNSGTGCNETVINLSASSSNSQEEAEIQTYYNFCPEDGDYCYFGPSDERQGYHLCSSKIPNERDPDSDQSSRRANFEQDPANGRCGDNNNECPIGELQDVSDTDTHYQWQCVGINGGATADCEKRIPIDGVCDNTQRNSCSAGEADDEAIADNTTYYKWACEGLYDGTTANDCQIRKPIDGVCDNSQRNGCSTGDPDDAVIADTETHYRWHCEGLHGGTTATGCQRELPPQPVNGACNNSQRNACTSGNPSDSAISDTSTHYRWHCLGLNGGTTAEDCQIARPVNGVCNNSKRNGCSVGTPDANAISDTNTYYRWHCVGLRGGNTATSCQIEKPVNGACNNSVRNGCSTGTPDANAISDTNTYYRWHCVGLHGGNTATSCQIEKPVNGACNNSVRNGCSNGTPDANAISDTNTYYRWHCIGLHGGNTATSCQIEKPVNGACNNSVRNGCTVGTPSPISDSLTHHRWHCEGLHGGDTVENCQIVIPPDPVNGTCDNSVKNGCSLGTANDAAISDTGTHYRWHCEGLHGGTTARNCQKAIPINGACNNSQRNGCSVGTLNANAISDTSTHYRWHCEGLHGGNTARNCQIRKPINGACNNSVRNGCSVGTANDAAISDTGTHYRWHCEGLHSGTTAENCQIRKPINGACNNSVRNGCSVGTANDAAISDTGTHYRWHCEGLNGGTTARSCQRAIPINGVCNNSQRNSCSAGIPNDSAIADTPTLYKWHCVGRNGGTTATTCQRTIPINGACNNNQRNGCSAGTLNDTAVDDTSTHYTWYCLGSNGGSTARNCQKAKPINGVCDNTERNGCSAGTPNDAAADDTTTHYVWNCDGLHGGTTATGCEKIRPIHGSCNNNAVNDCRFGTLEDIDDTETQYKWRCKGLNGGRTATCAKSIYTNGDCGRHRDWCDKGTLRDIDDTDVHYLWECLSPDGGTTASCQQLKQTARCGGNVTWNEEADQYLIEISTCLVGTPTEREDTADQHKWRCDWYGSVAFCSAAKHGQCLTSFPWCNSRSKRTSVNEEAGTWNCAGGTSTANCSR